MSRASEEYAAQKTAQSLDTIRVHNPTSEDFIMWYDKAGPQRRKFMVPKAQQDIGSGKGIVDLPRYMAKIYSKGMVELEITRISDPDWEKKKKQYRTRDEMLKHAEVEQIRTNDPNYWFQYFPYSKESRERILTPELTLDILVEEEKEYRKNNHINIPVKTLVWLGVVEKFGGITIPDPEEVVSVLDNDPFGD